jgi:hypothetical protein
MWKSWPQNKVPNAKKKKNLVAVQTVEIRLSQYTSL